MKNEKLRMNENIISTIVSINYIEKYISSEYTLSKIIDCKLLQSSTNLIYEIQTLSQKSPNSQKYQTYNKQKKQ